MAARPGRRTRWGRALATGLAAALTAGLAAGVAASPPAALAAPEPPRPPFYDAPAELPARPGALIRSEEVSLAIDPLGLAGLLRSAHRVLYRSTDRAGEPVAVSGTVFVPRTPWRGPGRRPVIGYAPGTQGLADRCAPSRSLAEGLQYESLGVEQLVARGWAVALTDYEGLGTEGVHTYVDRLAQGRAVLDAVRAAMRLPGAGLDRRHPVGLVGYSQGGGAVASAAELASTYGRGLRVVGTAAGAVPADLGRVAGQLDGSLYAAFALFAIRGLAASYDLDTTPFVNAEGAERLEAVEQDCVTDLLDHAFVQGRTLTADGSTLTELLARDRLGRIVAEQRIGRTRPAAPVLVTHSRLDDVIPFGVGEQLVADWCARGATVRFSANLAPGHVGGVLPHLGRTGRWLAARFRGEPAPTTC